MGGDELCSGRASTGKLCIRTASKPMLRLYWSCARSGNADRGLARVEGELVGGRGFGMGGLDELLPELRELGDLLRYGLLVVRIIAPAGLRYLVRSELRVDEIALHRSLPCDGLPQRDLCGLELVLRERISISWGRRRQV